MKNESAKKLLDFMKKSPTRYQVVANFEAMLNEKGYEKLYTEKPWKLARGGKYYVSPNGSSIMAFRIPAEPTAGFMLSAAHSDSPTFKIRIIRKRPARIMCSLQPSATAARSCPPGLIVRFQLRAACLCAGRTAALRPSL